MIFDFTTPTSSSHVASISCKLGYAMQFFYDVLLSFWTNNLAKHADR